METYSGAPVGCISPVSTPTALEWSYGLKHMKAGMPMSHALSNNGEAMLIRAAIRGGC
ncbi:MAG: hypothetical protein ACOC5M_02890 [Chloroflexota bacterium]